MLFVLLFVFRVCAGVEVDDKPSSDELRNAFLLTSAAGLSTVIGAGAACCVKWDDLKKERSIFLAAWLSFAASVMVYVSLVEIWHESRQKFEEVTYNAQIAHMYTSITFFGGVAVGALFSKIVHLCEIVRSTRKLSSQSRVCKPTSEKKRQQSVQIHPGNESKDIEGEYEVAIPFVDANERKTHLLRTAIVTAISIALHNFPEGVVTFLAALADWHVGVATAFAIAMHNIPEGISISIPYYYASESRWKPFIIALFSGLAEPLGALIGWAIVGNIWGPEIFGLMFGLTAGIMVYISFHELLPLARKNDPDDRVMTSMIFLGMIVMDVSLFVAA